MLYFFCIFFRNLDGISDLHNPLPTFILISVISIVVVKLLISFVSSGIVSSLSYYFNQSLLSYVQCILSLLFCGVSVSCAKQTSQQPQRTSINGHSPLQAVKLKSEQESPCMNIITFCGARGFANCDVSTSQANASPGDAMILLIALCLCHIKISSREPVSGPDLCQDPAASHLTLNGYPRHFNILLDFNLAFSIFCVRVT